VNASAGRGRLELQTPGPRIVLFDGICNLCTGSVIFILRRDPRANLRFASIQSAAGERILESCGLPRDFAESIIYIEDGQPFTKSTAALKIVRNLKPPWPLLYIAKIIPTRIRDGAYDWIARNRYSIFGKRDSCLAPSPDFRSRFL
jgi:predicted DCC family thiol-disulfide oxidoreductase YuxK